MSKRHRSEDGVPLPRAELRAHAHNERHRVKGELHELATQVRNGMEPDDAVEPGAAWKPAHHHDAERAVKKITGSRKLRHWKMKEWKRRTVVRQQKIAAYRHLARLS
jgi:hypothetical protein